MIDSLKKAIDSPMISNVNNWIEQIKADIEKYNKKAKENDLAE